MKLTKPKLRQIIKEEFGKVLNENPEKILKKYRKNLQKASKNIHLFWKKIRNNIEKILRKS